MSNTNSRRSARIANKQAANSYDIAAKVALGSSAKPPARVYNKNEPPQTFPNSQASSSAPKPFVPFDVKKQILEKYNITVPETPAIETSSSSTQETSTAPPVQNNAPINVQNVNTQLQDKGKQKENNNTTFVIPLATQYIAATLAKHLSGSSKNQKLKNTDRIFAHLSGYTGASHRTIQKEQYILAYFYSADDLQTALTIECTFMETQQIVNVTNADQSNAGSTTTDTQTSNVAATPPFKLPQKYFFVNFESIKQRKTPDQIQNEKERTIQVIDIPLKLQTATVRATFSSYGTIEKITMRTRGLYQQAFITFESVDHVTQFYDLYWTIYITSYAVRVIPLALDEVRRLKRRNFGMKLAGIPARANARDLIPFLKEISAKTCFIPVNPNNYKPLNYAYINFESEKTLAAAVNRECSLKGFNLYWAMENTPTCHICGSPDHIARDCSDPRNRNTQKQQKLQKLYNRFKPAQHRRPKKSYAAAANGKGKGSSPQQTISKDELPNILNALQLLTDKMVRFENQLIIIDREIANQKQATPPPKHTPPLHTKPKNNVNPDNITKQNTQQKPNDKKRRFYTSSEGEPQVISSSSTTQNRSPSPELIQIEQKQLEMKGDVNDIKNLLSNLAETVQRATSPQTNIMDEDMEDYNEYDENFENYDEQNYLEHDQL
jgi:hypothetical protein